MGLTFRKGLLTLTMPKASKAGFSLSLWNALPLMALSIEVLFKIVDSQATWQFHCYEELLDAQERGIPPSTKGRLIIGHVLYQKDV